MLNRRFLRKKIKTCFQDCYCFLNTKENRPGAMRLKWCSVISFPIQGCLIIIILFWQHCGTLGPIPRDDTRPLQSTSPLRHSSEPTWSLGLEVKQWARVFGGILVSKIRCSTLSILPQKTWGSPDFLKFLVSGNCSNIYKYFSPDWL